LGSLTQFSQPNLDSHNRSELNGHYRARGASAYWHSDSSRNVGKFSRTRRHYDGAGNANHTLTT
jgi:hypothetical protein